MGKESTMKTLGDALKGDWLIHLKQHAIKTNVKEPKVIHHRNLEKANLLQKEVVNGVPQIKINLLESCSWNGCTSSHSGIHTRQEIKVVDDVIEYKPVMIEENGKKKEDKSKRPENLIEDEGLWIPIKREYKFGVPCKYCGLTNKYLMRFQKSGLTSDAINKHVANYDFEEGLEQKALDFVQGKIRGGMIFGPPGNGKTHLLCAIARELIWNGKQVRYVSHQQLLEQIKQSFDKNSEVVDPRYSWLDGIDVVLFDELGFFRMNEWSKQISNELIHAIHAAGVQVLFASNLSPKEMKNKFLDIRSLSRIGEMCQDFKHQMRGIDRRSNGDFWT
jgi:DNA replication protein DnaC